MQKLFLFIIGAIIYGSLFPFTFSALDSAARWQTLLRDSFAPFTSLGDILGNIVLFMPYGYLALAPKESSLRKKPSYLKYFLYGLVLAFVIQVVQVYIPARSPAMADVYWNGVGILAGFAAHHLTQRYFPGLSFTTARNTPALLALCWLLYLLFPFIPSLDFQAIKNSIKPVLLTPDFRWHAFIISTTGWLLFAHFTRNLFLGSWLNPLRLPLIALLSLPLRMIIIQNSLTLSDLSAVLFAIVIWIVFQGQKIDRGKGLAALLAVSITIYSIGSLDFSSQFSSFYWVPFSGFLDGNLFTNTKSLFFKVFLFGSLVWQVKLHWPTLRLKTFWLFLFILLLELIQITMPSRTAEITDPVLILLLSLLIQVRSTTHRRNETSSPEDLFSPAPVTDAPTSQPPAPGSKRNLLSFWGSLIVITALLAILIRLPGVPYNVRELFRLDGSIIAILPFTCFILWFGMSIPWISRRMLTHPNFHFVFFPLWVIAAGLISYSLLKISVTEEALDDIVGSSNIYWFVTNRAIWGDAGLWLSQLLPFPALWNGLEEIVRFLALFSPLTFLLSMFYTTGDLIKKYNIQGATAKLRLTLLSLGLNLLYALPWFYLCKVIAFDHSSTDNLNELIARQGVLGGGGTALYGLIILLTLNSVWVRQARVHWLLKGVSITGAGVLCWFLLNMGLEPEVQKYGLTFSGVDFLLGPDRKNRLDETILFGRWIFLYVGSITILAWGMRFDVKSLLPQKKHKENRKYYG
ncbi:VanZ family protein [Paremcibacter congregatus]|uniref:VanZ family protein n=1 Tax=Paremcibacter congregatus TaxID=2043170 RepID=UPI0030EC10C0|tara:strand:+ start:2123 stop:4360 length:2238 start_codon:yes stop_codon:yes gene_type:complete